MKLLKKHNQIAKLGKKMGIGFIPFALVLALLPINDAVAYDIAN